MIRVHYWAVTRRYWLNTCVGVVSGGTAPTSTVVGDVSGEKAYSELPLTSLLGRRRDGRRIVVSIGRFRAHRGPTALSGVIG
jgi:hypothetical protein